MAGVVVGRVLREQERWWGGSVGALPPRWLEPQAGGGGHHRPAPVVDGGDDFLRVYALQVDRGGAEVGVTELSLDDVQRHAFASELERVGVAELMRRKPASYPGVGGETVEFKSHGGA
jgi:hypothetical protein